jgi:hypothetical protein
VNKLYSLEEWRGEHRIFNAGDHLHSYCMYVLGDKVHSREPTSPLGSNFTPRGDIKSLPLFFTHPKVVLNINELSVKKLVGNNVFMYFSIIDLSVVC